MLGDEPGEPSRGLRAKIEDHNRYNGFVVSAVEFAAVAVVTGALAVVFAAAGKWPAALVAAGIAANCVPVVVLAVASRRRGEPQVGYSGLISPQVRRDIRAARPHLLRDTLTITVLTLVPYAAVLWLLAERRRT